MRVCFIKLWFWYGPYINYIANDSLEMTCARLHLSMCCFCIAVQNSQYAAQRKAFILHLHLSMASRPLEHALRAVPPLSVWTKFFFCKSQYCSDTRQHYQTMPLNVSSFLANMDIIYWNHWFNVHVGSMFESYLLNLWQAFWRGAYNWRALVQRISLHMKAMFFSLYASWLIATLLEETG